MFLADSLSPGEADERVLVPEPLCKADGPAHQEDAGQDSQLSGEGQRVVRRTFAEGVEEKKETFSFNIFGVSCLVTRIGSVAKSLALVERT